MMPNEPELDSGLVEITVKIPARHAVALDRLAAETETDRGQIIAQAIAMLDAVFMGTWRVENNYAPDGMKSRASIESLLHHYKEGKCKTAASAEDGIKILEWVLGK